MKLSRHLRTGLGAVTAAAIWAGLDALVHVRADEVEPLRIAGNIAVWIACGASMVAVQVVGGPKLAAVACGLGAGAVLGLNLAWATAHGELPGPAVIFFGLAVLLLLLAAWRFFLAARTRGSA